MKVRELIEKLNEFPQDAEVKRLDGEWPDITPLYDSTRNVVFLFNANHNA